MSRVFVPLGFDIAQLRLGDFAASAVSATATTVTYTLGGQVLTLFGSFTLAAGVPVDGTITRIRYAEAGSTLLNLTQASISFLDFETALANDQFGDLLASSDQILGTSADDRLRGFDGNDSLTAFAGDDSLFGGLGDDTLNGASGDDLMLGGSGNDVYRVDSTGDLVFEARDGGIDRVETDLSSYNLRINFEDLSYSDVGNFNGVGNILDNRIIGNVGNDTLNGLDGDDTLLGGNGNDRLIGADGDDLLVGDSAGVAVINSVSVAAPGGGGDIVLTMELPETSTTTTTTVRGYVGDGVVSSTALNLAFVIDVSGSMGSGFTGSDVGDQNGDGQLNTKIDAAIAAFAQLIAEIEATGFGSTANIALIPFGSDAEVRAFGTAVTDLNMNGVSDLVDAARTLDDGGSTNYTDALQEAVGFFSAAEPGTNQIFFLSDGEPNSGSYQSQLNALRDPDGIDASIRALGIEITANGFNILDELDDGILNGSAIQVDDPATLNAGLLTPQIDIASIAGLEILRNGVVIETLSPGDLISTPFGLRYSASITGLSPARSDLIEARLILNDPGSTSVTTSQQISVGPLASNDLLLGGNGDDTLDGGAGVDTLNGGAGNDVYRVDSGADRIVELAGNGNDLVESTVSFSLNRVMTANVENLTLLGSMNLNGGGNANDNVIIGNLANNTLRGFAGNDTINGGAGFDALAYDFATAAVTVILSNGVGTGSSNGDIDQISNIEMIIGSDFNDSLRGADADETFVGGMGNDTIDGRNGFDTLDFSTATSAVTVSLTQAATSAGVGTSANGMVGTDTYFNIEGVIGSGFGDLIEDGNFFNNLANRFEGGAGDDTLNGGFGADTLIGGLGDDILDGGASFSPTAPQIDVVDYSGSSAAISGNLASQISGAAVGTDTLIGIEHIIATGFDDSIIGTTGDDLIDGGAGNDTLAGTSGADTLIGGTGDDRMTGGSGDDQFHVDSAGDVVIEFVNGGVDTVLTTTNFRLINANLENLTVDTTVGVNALGNALANIITGNVGNDNLVGFGGNDTLLGLDGDDTLRGGGGADSLNGGNGRDWASFSDLLSGVSGTLNRTSTSTFLSAAGADTLQAIENVLGSNSADVINGDFDANHIIGAGGGDTLDGGSGDDTIEGGNGNDSLDGSGNNDLILGDAGNDTLLGGSGNDTLEGGSGNDSLDGESGFDAVSYLSLASGRIDANLSTGVIDVLGGGQDTIVSIESVTGTERSDTIAWDPLSGTSFTAYELIGGRGADVLTTSSGRDTLDGGIGADTMTGGNGNDTYIVDNVGDVIVEVAGQGVDTVISSINYVLSEFLENLTLTGTAVIATGNDFNNTIFGNAEDNVIVGGGGLDLITGGLGRDTMDGGAMDGVRDTFDFNSVDESRADAADLVLNFVAGEDRLDFINVDGNSLAAGTQRFTWIAEQSFNGVEGELRFGNDGTNTFVEGDTDGDRVADFVVEIQGVITLTTLEVLV